MKSEGLTSSRLAEMLEVQPSGISHILSGRNKPGFDFLQKILRRFPQINPDWLLLDSGAMYRAMQGEMSANQAAEVAGAAGSPAADGHDTGLLTVLPPVFPMLLPALSLVLRALRVLHRRVSVLSMRLLFPVGSPVV